MAAYLSWTKSVSKEEFILINLLKHHRHNRETSIIKLNIGSYNHIEMLRKSINHKYKATKQINIWIEHNYQYSVINMIKEKIKKIIKCDKSQNHIIRKSAFTSCYA